MLNTFLFLFDSSKLRTRENEKVQQVRGHHIGKSRKLPSHILSADNKEGGGRYGACFRYSNLGREIFVP